MQKGMTLIELLIIMAILGIIAAILYPAITGKTPQGFHPRVDTRCVGGYVVAVGYRGSVTQLLDDRGHGIPCN